MAAAMSATTFFGTGIPVVQAADDGWVGVEDLRDHSTEEPAKDDVLPSTNQYNYQKEELAAFCHFGPNTFNNIEWGENYGGRIPSDIFPLSNDFDAKTLVQAVKDAGFHKIIVTAKHHDGFCIWNSAHTDYDVAPENYTDGPDVQRDVLKEISAACSELDIDMGLYLSPWDIHDDSYGYYDAEGNALVGSNGQPLNGKTWEEVEELDADDYNDYYNNQLEEILGNDAYGNDGHFVEVWMDGAKGSGANAQNYDFERWFETIQKHEGKASQKYDSDCMLFGAGAYTTVRWIGNENGIAGEDTWSKSRVDYDANTIDSRSSGGTTLGWEDGNQWTVPEADARITSGWFWGPNKAAPKSLSELANMYFNSVGHNSPLLLNIPPNNQGTVDKAILDRLAEFGQNIKDTFDENLAAAEGAEVFASNVRGNDTKFSPANVTDGEDDTYWTTEDGENSGSILLDLGSAKKFDVVSIEEAIQNGQRINNYKVEYRNGNGAWTLLKEGETIGAKRLIRVPAVTADQVKITVETTDDKVPMISEAGVYKASAGFELAASAPTGMEVIDISDTDVSDGKGFTFSNGWTNESGSQYVNETNTWANTGAKFTLKFTGTKVYLVGTKDSGHGTATIQIDDGDPITVDTNASSRSTGQIWFSSEDLEDTTHTLTLTVASKAIGIEAAYVINNGGIGMLGLEADEYTMNEDSTINVKVIRVGGTEGRIKATLSPNPGTAVQGDFDTAARTVTLGDGEKETTVPVTTRRNINQTGTQDFSIQLDSPSTGLILGFIDTATVNILDTESMTEEQLQGLIDSVADWRAETYIGDWDAFTNALSAARLLLEGDPSAEQINTAYLALDSAKSALTKRAQYTEGDPFVLPTKEGQIVRAEAEFFELDASGAVNPSNYIRLTKDANCSNDTCINWFENGNKMYLYYNAPQAGTYEVTFRYASGRTSGSPNKFSIAEENNKASADEQSVYGPTASEWKEATFDLKVTEAGLGKLIFSTTAGGPKIDYFEITPKSIDAFTYDVKASATEGGTITPAGTSSVAAGGNIEYTITPNPGYVISQVMVGSADVTDDVTEEGTLTVSGVQSDTTVNVMFTFANYTEENRFEFPTEKGEENKVTLEAENMILHNVGDEPEWYIQVSKADWASGGKYVDAMKSGDTMELHYYADKVGEYKAILQYRSGDAGNSLEWTENEENVESGSLNSVTAEPYPQELQIHTAELSWKVTRPGAGKIVFTTGEKGAPQLDKFDVQLVEATDSIADTTDLEIAIQDAERELAKTDTYTEETRNALQTALNTAKALFEKAGRGELVLQSEADAQVTAITDAIDKLAPPTYEINTSVAGGIGGTVTASKPTVDRGESVDLTIVPDYGYEAVSIQVNNEVINSDPGTAQNPETEFYGPNGRYTISNITEDQTVVVTFKKTGYTEEERFTFPTAGNTAELDAAKATLFNSGGNGEKWKLDVSTADWAQDGFINSMNSGDKICIPYTAAETGEYTVTVVYRSGSNSNGFSWSEADDKIESGSVTAGANDSAGATHKQEFTMNVVAADDGILTIAAGASGAPQIDKLVISKAGTQPDPEDKFTITASVKDNVGGTVSVDPTEVTAGKSATVTFTPAEGYKVGTVTVNDTDTEVTGNSLTLSNITENKEVIVTYELDYYTENNRFYLPTEVNGASKTVQAEHFILKGSGDEAAQEIREVEGTWAEGGIFVDWFNNGDSIVLNYFAQKAGTYTFVMTYQSGSATNGISWSGDNITSGTLTLADNEVDSDNNLKTRYKTFKVEINQPGAGQLTIAAGEGKAPRIDQFEISLTEETSAATVNKDALKQAIDKAKDKLTDTQYTQESRDELKVAIAEAQNVYEDPDATQEQVDEQKDLLNNFLLVKAPVTYTVTADAGANGSITLTGEAEDGSVEEGQDAAYTVTADSGYVIDTLTVNGAEVAEAKGLETYSGTVADVNANVTIAATFKLKDSGTITNKKDLWDAIEDARAILKQTDKYTATSLEEYGKIIDAAYAVYESDNADADDIAAAIQSLKDGLSVLVEQGGGTTDPGTPGTGDDKPGTGSGGDSSGNGKPQGGSGSGKDTVKAAQTGDDTNVMIWIIALAAAAAAGGAVLVIRKRSTR